MKTDKLKLQWKYTPMVVVFTTKTKILLRKVEDTTENNFNRNGRNRRNSSGFHFCLSADNGRRKCNRDLGGSWSDPNASEGTCWSMTANDRTISEQWLSK